MNGPGGEGSAGAVPEDEGFRRRHFRRLSSHPRAIRWRGRILLSFVVMLIGWLIFSIASTLLTHHSRALVSSLMPTALMTRLVDAPGALPAGVREAARSFVRSQQPAPAPEPGELLRWLGLAALAGAMLAVALCDRWAAFQAARRPLREGMQQEADRLSLAGALLALGLIIVLLVLPVLAWRFAWLSAVEALMLDAALFGGLFLLLAFAGLAQPARGRRRGIFLLLAFGLLAVPVYDHLAGSLVSGSAGLMLPRLKALGLPEIGLAGPVRYALLAGAALAFLAWLYLPARRRTKPSPPSAQPAPLDPRRFIEQLLAELQLPPGSVRELALSPKAGEASPPAGSPEFWPLLMQGLVPTRDQLAFLQRYREGSRAFLQRLQRSPGETDWWNGLNLLLPGKEGSGRSTALIAAAVYAATAAGAAALLVVPHADKRRWMRARIAGTLSAARLAGHFDVAELDARCVAGVVERGGPIPSILVATPQDLEAHIFGRLHVPLAPTSRASAGVKVQTDADPIQAVNARADALLDVLATVFVENFSDFDPLVRSHLAFQLDKLRLRLAARGRALACVVAAPPLESEAAVALAARLFGEPGFHPEKDIFLLRPPMPRTEGFAGLELTSENPAALAQRLTAAVLGHGRSAVVYCRGIDEETCRDREAAIRAEVQPRQGVPGAGAVMVLGDLDQAASGRPGFDAVVYENLRTRDASVAVGARLGAGQCVLFHLRPQQALRLIEPRPSAVPVAAEREASAMAHAHLLSLWAGLKPGDNLEAAWLSRFMPQSAEPAAPGQGAGYLALRALAPAPGAEPGSGLLALERIQPAAVRALSVEEAPREALRLAQAPEPGLLALLPPREMPRLQAGQSAPTESTRLIWMWSGGVIRERALEHTPTLRLHGEDGTFAAGTLEARDGHLRIQARHYLGRGNDRTVPCLRLAWTLAQPASAIHFGRWGGGADYGLGWFDLRRPDGALLAFTVEGAVTGLLAEDGKRTELEPLPFGFTATASLLVPGQWSNEALRDTALYAEPWRSEHCDAQATEALAAFLCEELDGGATFCWPLVLEREARRYIWLLQPASTGPAVGELLFELLRASGEFRTRFLKAVEASPNGLAPLPRFSHG